MSTLIISPKPFSSYNFKWDQKINIFYIDLYETILNFTHNLLPEQFDKYDKKIVLKSISNIIKQRILNGETLFLYVNSSSEDDENYHSLNFIVGKIINFIKSLYTCNIVLLNPDNFYNKKDDNIFSIVKDVSIMFSGDNKTIKENLQTYLENDIVNLNKYDEVVRIGDIQGCLTNLKMAFPNGIDKNKFYIFLGDYIDRGPDSLGVLEWLKENCFINNKLKENVVLLIGNHERHLITWTLGMEPTSNSFMNTTLTQINYDAHNELINLILSSLQSSFIYTYKGHTTICCHGGIEYDLPKYPFHWMNMDDRDNEYWYNWSVGGLRNMWQLSDKTLYGSFINKDSNIGERFIKNMITYYVRNNNLINTMTDCMINLELVYGHFHISGTDLSWENNEYNVRSICHENDVDRGGSLVISCDYGDNFKIFLF